MLIISILMLVRKKTKIRIAYSLLALGSFSIIAYDANLRENPHLNSSEVSRKLEIGESVPLPMTRLAESPFPEARPGHRLASDPAVGNAGQAPTAIRENAAKPSAAWFLTVAVKVDSGTKEVALHRGTKVYLVREQDGKFLVRRNGTDFLIEKTQVTDNIASLGELTRNSS